MWAPTFFAWLFLTNHYQIISWAPFSQNFLLSPDIFEQNLHISSKSYPSISWRPRIYPIMSSLLNPWCYHTKPKKYCISPTPSCEWAIPTCSCRCYSFCWPFFRRQLPGVPRWENSPFSFIFLFDMAQRSIIWGPGVIRWYSNTSPHSNSHVYSSPVTWISHWVKFIMPGFVSRRGNPLWEIYSGPCAKRLWEGHPTSIIHQCVWTKTVDWIFFPEGTDVCPLRLFH